MYDMMYKEGINPLMGFGMIDSLIQEKWNEEETSSRFQVADAFILD